MPPSSQPSYPLPEDAEVGYQEFVSREMPTDLREEIAVQRSFLKQTMEGMRYRSMEDQLRLAGVIADTLKKQLTTMGVNPEHTERICAQFKGKPLMDTLNENVPTQPDPKMVTVVHRLLTGIATTAERMERIQRGRRIKVQIDSNMLSWLVRTFILKFVPRASWGPFTQALRQHGLSESAKDVEALESGSG